MEEEKRKVQMTGGSTLIVSLPIDWARSVGINQGDEVTLIRGADNSILITTGTKKQEAFSTVIELFPDEKPEDILRLLIANYLVGYDIIKLISREGFSTQDRKWIKDSVRQGLIGLEVVDESGDELILQSLLNYEELSLEKTFQRMARILKSMQKDSITALKDGNVALARDVIQRDNEVDRFYLLIVRQLKAAIGDYKVAKKMGIEHQRECMGYRLIAKSMERIADHAEKIAKDATQMKGIDPKLTAEITEAGDFVLNSFDNVFACLFKKDVKAANKAIAESQEAVELVTAVSERVLKNRHDTINQIHLRSALESLKRMAEYGVDISEMMINMSVKEPERWT
ncbi:MAG: phosphate uptake regulator PhoU [Methanosarcinales archaeon Met12]|nr:MAG: phosphate uptake regulator PhoU [Methanosarcinales archaeon Met12]